MILRHIENLEERLKQYSETINETINAENETINLDELDIKLLELIKEHPDYTYSQYAITLNMSRTTIARIIKKLSQNTISRVGSKKKGRWQINA